LAALGSEILSLFPTRLSRRSRSGRRQRSRKKW